MVSLGFVERYYFINIKYLVLIQYLKMILNKIYLEFTTGHNFCKVLATLNLTLATGSFAKLRTVGNITFWANSWPQDCANTLKKNMT